MSQNETVLTDGWECYIRLRRGVYARVSRSGHRMGGISTNFEPRPRWRPARRCSFVIPDDGLYCPVCGLYDTHYAMTGERSYCGIQSRKAAQYMRGAA